MTFKGIPLKSLAESDIEFDWTRAPVPKIAIIENPAKILARTGLLAPSEMGPPTNLPSWSTLLVATAKQTSAIFVVIHTIAASHIQKIDPGPPNSIAVETPIIEPAPIVPARAVETA